MRRVLVYRIGTITTSCLLGVLAGIDLGQERGRRPPIRRIEHLVVLVQANISFDHYFATYPRAVNLPGEPAFIARPHTPSVNGLNAGLLSNNPNSFQPF